MALEETQSVNVKKKEIGFLKTTGIRAYAVITGITSLAVGSEVFYGVMGKLMHTLPFALNLGVGMASGLAATAASAGIALVGGIAIASAVDFVDDVLDKNKKTNQNEVKYNEPQMGMN